jgi:hypothetical protein
MSSSIARWALASLAFGALPAAAVEVGDGKLSINGFGSWGYGVSNHGNSYELAQPDGHFDDGEFALALAARISERAVVAAQTHVSVSGGGLIIDFAFGEWRFSDVLRLRVGVVKHPFGIFAEVPLVGTLRPFFSLPAGAYGPSELSGSGVRGASLSGAFGSVSYDLYGGALTLPVSTVDEKISDPSALKPGGVIEIQQEEIKYVVGGRVILNTPVDGLDVRFSAYGTPRDQVDRRFVVGPSLQYLGEKFSARAEYFFLFEQGTTERDRQRTHAAYAEAAWFVAEKIQLGIRAEIFQLNLVGIPASPLGRHREVAATFDYWLDPGLVLKWSVHFIDGNRFANPLQYDDAILAGGPDQTTVATIFGTQFSF